jgi:hypothetical protein
VPRDADVTFFFTKKILVILRHYNPCFLFKIEVNPGWSSYVIAEVDFALLAASSILSLHRPTAMSFSANIFFSVSGDMKGKSSFFV